MPLYFTGRFGPVAPISVFADEVDALQRANATEYGLAAYVYTSDLSRTFRVVDAFGLRREGGPEEMHEYLETKYVALSLD